MQNTNDSVPRERTDEITIPASRVAPLIALVIGLLSSVLAAGALVVWVGSGIGLPANAVLACAGGTVLGVCVSGWAVRELLTASWLVLARDRLQLRRGSGRVMMDIPYRNIKGVTYLKVQNDRGVQIELLDPADPETCLNDPDAGTSSVFIPLTWTNFNAYAAKPRDVFETIQRRLDAFHEGQG